MPTRLDRFDKLKDEICSLAASKASSVEEYFQLCHGLFPVEASRRLNRSLGAGKRLEAGADASSISRRASFIYSAWDFVPKSARKIVEVCGLKAHRVLCLGAPSIVPYLPSRGQRARHVLIDIGRGDFAENADYLHYDVLSLRGSEFTNAFDACVLDPPWYLDETLHWIRIAHASCTAGAVIALPLLGVLTRPSASDDRVRIISEFERLGMSVTLYESEILYKVPSFEATSLALNGISPVPWKRADLLVGYVAKKTESAPHTFRRLRQEPPVFQVNLADGLVEVALDRHASDAELWEIPSGGAMMPSPSRRESGNAVSNFFTSHGVRMVCRRPSEVLSAMAHCEREKKSVLDLFSEIKLPLSEVTSSVDAISGERWELLL